jgi:hypothetical protein
MTASRTVLSTAMHTYGKMKNPAVVALLSGIMHRPSAFLTICTAGAPQTFQMSWWIPKGAVAVVLVVVVVLLLLTCCADRDHALTSGSKVACTAP